jgi:hypothetical protein
MIINANGGCIPRATVQVVRGQSAGQSVEQETPCGAWDYDGGFFFRNLVPGVAMTFRLSAPGYVDLEETVTPTLGPQMAFLFELKPVSQP